MKKNKLLSSSLVYTIGNLLIQGLSFITLPIYTRIISTDDYGTYNLYTSWLTMLVIFVGLQMSGSFSIAKIKYTDEFDNYVATVTTVSFIFFTIVFSLSMFFKTTIANYLGFGVGVVIVLLWQAYLSHLNGSFSQYFVQNQNSMNQLKLSMFSALSNVILSITLVYIMKDDFIARVIGGFFPNIVIAIIFIIFIYKKSSTIFDKKYVKFIFITSIPLVFHILGHNILNQLDRIMIGEYMNTTSVAIYSFGYSIGLIIQIVLMSMNTAWIPWFFEEKRRGSVALIKKYKERYLVIGTFLTIGYLSVFPELVDIMGTGVYKESKEFIVWIVISYFIVFLYTFPVNIQFYNENTKYIPVGTLMAAAINYVANIYFIKSYGIYGAAIATFISYLLLLVFHHIVAKKKYNYNEITIKGYVILIGVVCLYGLFAMFMLNYLLVRWLVCFVVFLGVILYYKKDIEQLFNSIKKKR